MLIYVYVYVYVYVGGEEEAGRSEERKGNEQDERDEKKIRSDGSKFQFV